MNPYPAVLLQNMCTLIYFSISIPLPKYMVTPKVISNKFVGVGIIFVGWIYFLNAVIYLSKRNNTICILTLLDEKTENILGVFRLINFMPMFSLCGLIKPISRNSSFSSVPQYCSSNSNLL